MTDAIVANKSQKKKPNVPPRGLTDRFLLNLKGIGRDYELPDRSTRGLRIRVSERGSLSFVWYWRDGTRVRRYTFGRYGDGDGMLKLSKARAELTDKKELLAQGIKPSGTDKTLPRTWRELEGSFVPEITVSDRP